MPRWNGRALMPKPARAASSCPVLADLGLLGRFCAASPLPVNFMAWPGAPSAAEVAA